MQMQQGPALKTGTLIGLLFRDQQSRFYVRYSFRNNDTAEVLNVLETWDKEELEL